MGPTAPKKCHLASDRAPSNTWLPEPTQVSSPKRHLDRFSRLYPRNAMLKVKVEVGFFYSATYSGNAATSRAVHQLEVAVDWQEPMVLQRKLPPSTARVNVQLDYWTRGMQLANTPPLKSTTPGIHSLSFHQMAPPV